MADRITTSVINLDYYAHNLSEIKKIVGQDVGIMAIVKANAYGHGIEEIASRAVDSGAAYIGVVSLGELKRIRKFGLACPILILNYIDSDSLEEAINNDATITIMDEKIIDDIQEKALQLGKVVKTHIKVDTGMHRAGCNPDEVLIIAEKVSKSKNLILEGIFTHFAESENPDKSFTNEQLEIFNRCLSSLSRKNIKPKYIHCANSAGIIAHPDSHLNLVRPGLISYGLNPFDVRHEKYDYVKKNFKPILELKTKVVFVRNIKKGETVSYGRRWQAEIPSKLALLPVGYGDGWRRSPYNAGRVFVGGHFAPIVGSVTMDQIVINVTHIEDVKVGDEVILMGVPGLTADDIAVSYQTINYEVVTGLSDRITRKYI